MATKTRELADFILEEGIGGDADLGIQGEPHIRPGVLQPAVAGKLLDGTTNHSGAYGTAQSDGHSYYYTDIKGSNPIKDPRIGAHFGSQRHDIRSVQRLEHETAANNLIVCSVDGRKWFRTVGMLEDWLTRDAHGVYTFQNGSNQFFEITGYFNGFNMKVRSDNETKTAQVHVDGVQAHSAHAHSANVGTPLGSRYVDRNSLVNVDLTSASSLSSDTTLGIHTIKITRVAGGLYFSSIELIAQDTTSTTTRNHVNIPAQNVVSYGKKFNIGSNTLTNAVHKHYNPFAFKTDGSTAWASGAHNGTSWPVGTGSSHNIDTATSLGLENWKHSNNYYKPYNGGRVVRWIASDGTIKTSVNMMPPNARSLANSSSLANATAKANASIANNTFYPTMEAGALDSPQAEVAKAFYIREFGNGSANGGHGSTWEDLSTVPEEDGTEPNTAYVMDDGLTSYSGKPYYANTGHLDWDAGNHWYFTFIGTGFSYTLTENVPVSRPANKVVSSGKRKILA